MGFILEPAADAISSITGAKQAGQAAEKAGQLQAGMAEKGIEEQRRQFDKLVELMAPFVTSGQAAIGAQQGLIGLSGPEQQAQAIQALQTSPQMQAMIQQGENALLQQAAATGGLRGGNVQAALAQFRPQMLNQLINQQFANLGGLSQLGQAAAAGQASSGMAMAGDVGNLLGQQGAALAGGILAKGNVRRQTFGDVMKVAGTAAQAFF
jgi:hypothetical protein